MTDLLKRIKSHLSIIATDFGSQMTPLLLLEASLEIKRLRLALVKIEHTIGPLRPTCLGCQQEINEVLRIIREEAK